jgi:hypothetical protein
VGGSERERAPVFGLRALAFVVDAASVLFAAQRCGIGFVVVGLSASLSDNG